MIGGLIHGGLEPEQWGGSGRAADFFDLKGDVEALLATAGPVAAFDFAVAEHPALHPGQSARILRGGLEVGLLGMLHPRIAAELDLSGDTFLFQLAQEALAADRLPVFTQVSRFPAIRRDLALVIDAGVPFAVVESCVRSSAGELLRELILFDVYSGQNIDAGRKSLALGLILQASSQTLTDNFVDETVDRVVSALASELDARLRD
jgi:phenylalanyl-tRNA synthetase beta chain